jgi:hypothetical protein
VGQVYVAEAVVVSGDPIRLLGMPVNQYPSGRAIINGVPQPNTDFMFKEGMSITQEMIDRVRQLDP